MEWVVETGGRGGTFSGAKLFVRKVKSDEMEGADEKGNKKWYKKEGVQPKKKMMSLAQILSCTFCCNQSFLLGFSWKSDNITASNKKNTSKNLSEHLR